MYTERPSPISLQLFRTPWDPLDCDWGSHRRDRRPLYYIGRDQLPLPTTRSWLPISSVRKGGLLSVTCNKFTVCPRSLVQTYTDFLDILKETNSPYNTAIQGYCFLINPNANGGGGAVELQLAYYVKNMNIRQNARKKCKVRAMFFFNPDGRRGRQVEQ